MLLSRLAHTPNLDLRSTSTSPCATPLALRPHRQSLCRRDTSVVKLRCLARAGNDASPQQPEKTEPAAATTTTAEAADEASKSDAYNEIMNRRMGTSLSYRHELGLDFNRILPDLIVGSCLQTAADVDRLAEQEGVTTVFCIQEDTDMAYFNLDLQPILDRCQERGDIKHVRFPIHDFDPYDLRRKLPQAVARLAQEHDPRKGKIYIHCTAGMGRAPATALAYMNWIRGIQLDEGFKLLTSLRRCGPKVEAIRSATADLLLGYGPTDVTIMVTRAGSAQRVQVAGLDVGWHAPVDMERDPKLKHWVLRKKMFPGTYQYKLIIDGNWTYSADHMVTSDGGAANNLLEVIPSSMDNQTMATQMRYLTPGTRLSSEEQTQLRNMLCPWASSHEVLTVPSDQNPTAIMEEMKAEAEQVEARKRTVVMQQAKEQGVPAAAQQAAQ